MGQTIRVNESQQGGNMTPIEILDAIKTVDGVGSGLDADLLDGQEGSYYLNTSSVLGTSNIGDRVITNAKLTDMVANSVKTRGSSVAGVPSDTVLGAGQVLGRPKTGNVQALTRDQQRENIGLVRANTVTVTGNFSANTRREFSVAIAGVFTTSFISVIPNTILANDIKNANAIFTCIGRCEVDGTVIIDAVSNTNITISANALFKFLIVE